MNHYTDNSHCTCCPSLVEHIASHYDPNGLTTADEKAEDVLASFQQCFPKECDLTVDEVQLYVESRRSDD